MAGHGTEDCLAGSVAWWDHCNGSPRIPMGIDFHLIANFGALALITLAGPAVIFILFYRRGAL